MEKRANAFYSNAIRASRHLAEGNTIAAGNTAMKSKEAA